MAKRNVQTWYCPRCGDEGDIEHFTVKLEREVFVVCPVCGDYRLNRVYPGEPKTVFKPEVADRVPDSRKVA